MTTIYGMMDSGNCYKPRLLMAKLGRPFKHVEVSSHDGSTRSDAFTAKNPNAMVPLLEFDDGRLLAESNAMLLHLSEGTRFLPDDAYERALAYQWLFFEQYSHEPYIAVARFIARWLPAGHPRQADLPKLRERGHQALAVMEQALAQQPFLAPCGYSVADIALYAYTHEAHVGGIHLDDYPGIRAWIARVDSQPGFVPQVY